MLPYKIPREAVEPKQQNQINDVEIGKDLPVKFNSANGRIYKKKIKQHMTQETRNKYQEEALTT